MLHAGESHECCCEIRTGADKAAMQVLERRQGVNMRVNMKQAGDVFGEVSLMYSCPRSATVAATTDSHVWVLERAVFRHHVREIHESEASQVELFLNSVPLLASLSRDEKLQLLDALEEQVFEATSHVINEVRLCCH